MSFQKIKIDPKQGIVTYLLNINIKSINCFNIQKPKDNKDINNFYVILQLGSPSERSSTFNKENVKNSNRGIKFAVLFV